MGTAIRGHMIRAELDRSNETMGKKIRRGVTTKIPNLLVVGEREEEDGTVTWRRYGSRESQTMRMADFESLLVQQIRLRSRS
jgi:threonyl-tRNA synthetase